MATESKQTIISGSSGNTSFKCVAAHTLEWWVATPDPGLMSCLQWVHIYIYIYRCMYIHVYVYVYIYKCVHGTLVIADQCNHNRRAFLPSGTGRGAAQARRSRLSTSACWVDLPHTPWPYTPRPRYITNCSPIGLRIGPPGSLSLRCAAFSKWYAMHFQTPRDTDSNPSWEPFSDLAWPSDESCKPFIHCLNRRLTGWRSAGFGLGYGYYSLLKPVDSPVGGRRASALDMPILNFQVNS
jgi:hypothetical protein